jgi:osmotically-inducible protein OsmY
MAIDGGRLARQLGLWLALACSACGTATPLRESGLPVSGTPWDARPDPVIPRAPLEREDLADRGLKWAVRRGLSDLSGTISASIDLAVAGGTVTLSGTLPNAWQRRQAEAVTWAIGGVRSVDDRISIDPEIRADAAVTADVRAAVAEALPRMASRISVMVSNGIVVLGGSVPSWGARRLAEQRAADVAGVADVRVELAITGAPASPSDLSLRERMAAQLQLLRGGLDKDVHVDVQRGRVVLAGKVPTFALHRRLREAALRAGARDVDADDLRVQWEAGRSPANRPIPAAEARSLLTESLAGDPTLADLPMTVAVADRIATLRGQLPTLEARRRAIEIAEHSPGVLRVVNQLTIGPRTDSDARLARRIRRAIERDPYLDHSRVTVQVDHGRAHLVGAVDQEFEKERAARVVGRIAGVRQVINGLTVRPPQGP